MFKNIILFSHKAGQRLNGVEKTPLILKDLIKNNLKITNTPITNDLMINLFNLYQTNNQIEGRRINIGGDHSMSIATVANSIEQHNNLKVIWMDAHSDINTYESSLSKNFHGMPLGILTGLEKNKLYNFTDKMLDFKDILYVGIRDIDKFEQEIINEHNIKYITIDEIHQDTENVITNINSFIDNKPVHFSFDVDVLDKSIMPSTGTIVDNGLELDSCKKILDNMLDHNVVSVDITELNLDIGNIEESNKSLDNLKYLFNNYLF